LKNDHPFRGIEKIQEKIRKKGRVGTEFDRKTFIVIRSHSKLKISLSAHWKFQCLLADLLYSQNKSSPLELNQNDKFLVKKLMVSLHLKEIQIRAAVSNHEEITFK
jgi:hypothetical protein